MEICKPTFALVAKWIRAQDVYFTRPDSIRWDDGSRATINDYWNHQFDTQECIRRPKGGLEMRIYPEIIADARFDSNLGAWIIEGPGVVPSTLDEQDPQACDDTILLSLCRLPIFYRTRIHRPYQPNTLLPSTGTNAGFEPVQGDPSRNYVLQHCQERGIA